MPSHGAAAPNRARPNRLAARIGALPQFFAPPAVRLGPLAVAPVGCGTWSWGSRLLFGYTEARDAELKRVYQLLHESGLPILFDTADSYGAGGRSETLLGRFAVELEAATPFASLLPRAGRRAVVATKLAPFPSRLTAASFVASARASAARLGGRVDIGQAHWSPAAYGLGFQEDALLDGLAAARDAGLFESVGLSNFGPLGLRRAAARLRLCATPVVSNQCQYSLLSRAPETSGLVEAAAELEVLLIAYSPLCLGLLAGPAQPPKGPRGLLFRSRERDTARLRALLREVAAARGASVAQARSCGGVTEQPLARSLDSNRQPGRGQLDPRPRLSARARREHGSPGS